MRILTFFISTVLLCACQSTHYSGPVSDHYDGHHFYNPDSRTKDHRNYETISLWLAIMQHPWPNPPPKINFQKMFPQGSSKCKITWINHATILLETPKLNILLDPIYSYRASPLPWIGPARYHNPGRSFAQLPTIDLVLISHNHYDHMDLPTLHALQKKFNPLFIVPLGNKDFLQQNGISKVIAMDWWQQHNYHGATITMLPAVHDSRRGLFDSDKTLWASYGLHVGDKKIYFAGDSGYSRHFKNIALHWGHPDFSLLPIGAYEPRKLTKPFHMNPKEAVQAHLDLHSRASLGIHWGTFQLGAETFTQPITDLDAARRELGVPLQHFLVIPEGVPIYLTSSKTENKRP